MSMTCTVCRHPERVEVEISAVRGESYRNIAERYDLSATAVFRHVKDHLPAMLAASEEARDVCRAETVLEQIESLRDAALRILERSETMKDSELSLKALREARGCVELLARVIGELKDGPTVNVLVSAEWVQVQNLILGALSEHPAARLAVAGALKQLEAPNANAA